MDLTQFDIVLTEIINYLRYNGSYFSKTLVNFATIRIKKDEKKLQPISELLIETMLKNAEVQIQNDNLYDTLYVINVAKANFFESSIAINNALAKFVKDYLDDENDYDGIAFNRFLSDCTRKGVVIKWDKIIR